MTTTTTQAKTRTITLTDRPPVQIREDEWGVIASASWHDGKVESQANRRGWLKVRQHDDGRTLVYGGYDSNWESERGLRGGELLTPPGEGPLTAGDGRVVDGREIAAAIHRVAELVHAEQIADECIGDLPAEAI